MLPCAGQNSNFIDHLFTGNLLGHESDIADGRLRGWELRSFANLVGDYYVSPRFLDAVAVISQTLRLQQICEAATIACARALCRRMCKAGCASVTLHLVDADAHCEELAGGQ